MGTTQILHTHLDLTAQMQAFKHMSVLVYVQLFFFKV